MANEHLTDPHTGATSERLADAAQPILDAQDLRIEIWHDEWANFEGTAAQLQAEGLIPDGFEWPRAAADKRWQANGFNYWLCRTRPEGHKGPMRSWLEMDNWFVRVSLPGDYHSRIRRGFERRAEALRSEYRRYHTAEGLRERNAHWERYCQASRAKAFQAFKSILVPERKKLGRKPKAKPAV